MVSREVLQDKFRGAILGAFLGDAFGAGFEGMSPEQATAHLSTLSERFRRRYTDDTDMTLALAESIVEAGKLVPEGVANKFSQCCDLTRGYGMGTIRAILALRAGMAWHQVSRIAFEKGSFGNGAAMRVSPVGLFYHHDLQELRKAAIDQATLTHSHPLGQWGAVMQAASVGLAVLQDPARPFNREEIVTELREILWPGPVEYSKALKEMGDIFATEKKVSAKEVARRFGNGIEAHRSVPSASYLALTCSPDFKEAIRMAISLGGDTDTIASMAGAIVGAHVGQRGLPEDWIEQLEEGPRGLWFARDLASRLFVAWERFQRG